MAAVLAVGSVFDIRTHIAFVGLAPGAQAVWDRQTPATTLTWAIFNFVTLAVLPYWFFRYRLGYRPDSMLLRFDRPKAWVPYFILVGLPPIFFVATPEYYTTSITGHALTLVLFTLGSFLPIMITTQALPRRSRRCGPATPGCTSRPPTPSTSPRPQPSQPPSTCDDDDPAGPRRAPRSARRHRGTHR
jgi:hypothetical protein